MTKRGYGFTTTPIDPFLARVAKEAKPHQRFLVASSENKQTGEKKVVVLVRKTALPETPIKVLGRRVSRTSRSHPGIRVPGFLTICRATTNWERTANQAKNDLQLLKNTLLNRVVRVVVEVV